MSVMNQRILPDRVERMDASAAPPSHESHWTRYPAECTATVVLADGALARIRAIRADDTARLHAFHDKLSEETVYRRFFGTHPHLRPEEAERFTHVDYRDRLALVTELSDRLVAVARYDRPPGAEQAEVAFVVADELQGRGLGTLLLEHLAAAARRRGVAAFTAETLGTNHPMQEVFHQAGFPARQRISTGIAQVDFSIAPTDAYLEAVLRRDASASHARHQPALPTASGGAAGIICQSEAGASVVAEMCRHFGLEPSVVVVAESLGIDVGTGAAYLAADPSTKLVLIHADLIQTPARFTAHARALARRKPVLACVTGAWSANLCGQAGLELVEDVPSLGARAAERLAQIDDGSWRPSSRGALVDLDGCHVTAARAAIERPEASPDGVPGYGCLNPETVTELLAAYGITSADNRDRPAETPAVLLTINDHAGGSATARTGGSMGRARRMLPLTDQDATDLLAAGIPPGVPGAAGPVLRLARMIDDQPEICRIEARVCQSGLAALVRMWTDPVAARPDDPWLRRLPPQEETRMEAR
jgi:GNAT superfamily N-acetyltransferase